MMSETIRPCARHRHVSSEDLIREYRSDLEKARDVQQNLIPRQLPFVPGWEFAGVYWPARIVSGDYYDLFEITPGHLGVAIGDVSGKGLGPALVMVGVQAFIRSRLAQERACLSVFMNELNQYLLTNTPEEMFVTLFLAVLQVPTGRLSYVNGGHPPPIVLSPHGDELLRLVQGGPLLGILPEACYEAGQIDLEPGNLLSLFSDGLTDAPGANGGCFGEKRILSVLRAAREEPLTLTLMRLLKATESFVDGQDQGDDLSLLLIRRQERHP
jgi:phosphoserine phosphatase RsbU/P